MHINQKLNNTYLFNQLYFITVTNFLKVSFSLNQTFNIILLDLIFFGYDFPCHFTTRVIPITYILFYK